MSLWNCPTHGLYGGDVFCPQCGMNGHYATVEPATVTNELVERLRGVADKAASMNAVKRHADGTPDIFEVCGQAADTILSLRGAVQRAVDHFDARSELYTSDADTAAGMADILRAALNGEPTND